MRARTQPLLAAQALARPWPTRANRATKPDMCAQRAEQQPANDGAGGIAGVRGWRAGRAIGRRADTTVAVV